MAVITILKERTVPEVGVRCCAEMTYGRRAGFYHQPGMVYIKKRTKHSQCPKDATRMVNGKPYCAMHGPPG